MPLVHTGRRAESGEDRTAARNGREDAKPGPSSETSTRKRPFARSALTLTSAPSRRGVTAYFTAFSTSV